MIEIPEALVIANQVNSTIKGRKIVRVTAAHTPHKFAWYHGDPQAYPKLLEGNTIDRAAAYGSMVEIKAGTAAIVSGDGVNFRYHREGQKSPEKHQLLLELDDKSTVSLSIQMYGGIWCFADEGDFKNPYYKIAKEKPSPLSDEFDKAYFNDLLKVQKVQKLSLKAFLATEQRIPGLGNGVLQDILWKAAINPKCKVSTLSEDKKDILYNVIKSVLSEMAALNGRNTEKDFLGNKGGYQTNMSKNNVGSTCSRCNGTVKKENYLGGSIYYCEKCQAI